MFLYIRTVLQMNAITTILDNISKGQTISQQFKGTLLRVDEFDANVTATVTSPAMTLPSGGFVAISLDQGRGVVTVGTKLLQPAAGSLSFSGISSALNDSQWQTYGSADVALPVLLGTPPATLAVVRLQDAQLFDQVYPQFSLDFNISALETPILDFLSALENSNFDLVGMFFFSIEVRSAVNCEVCPTTFCVCIFALQIL